MSTDNKPRLGVCPIGKFVFSHEDAMRQKQAVLQKLDSWAVNYCTVDDAIPDGMVRDQAHVAPVVESLRAKQIDALFVPHCNFGTEGAVGMIAQKLGVPVLLWGPRDEAPLADGSRLRDSLCGMFASSKVLRKLNVPFSYINNCSVDDQSFHDGLDCFLRAAGVVRAMKTMRIGQIGVRIDFFWTTINNESELLERFGVEVLPVDIHDLLDRVQGRFAKNRAHYEKELTHFRSQGLDTSSLETTEGVLKSLALRDELLELAQEQNLDALCVKSFASIPNTLGPGCGFGLGLIEEHLPVAPESDLHGAISSVLLKAASRVDDVVFCPEYTIRHPDNDNAILLWHGSGPWCLRHPDNQQVGFEPPWILKDLPPNNLQFRLKEGPLTVCRFDGDSNDYYLGTGQGHTVDGPTTREFYTWMEVDDWPQWERRIITGPYIHHCAAIYDHCADAIEEAGRYIPGLKVERYDQQE